MKKLKSVTAILLLLSMVLAACTSGNGSNTNNAGKPSNTDGNGGSNASQTDNTQEAGYSDVVDIDWYVNLSWWKYSGDYGKDKFSKLIKERFGLNINFITPAGDGSEQMSAMIATGEVPDMITVESWMDYKTNLAKGGYLISMNELIEQYVPQFKPYEDIFNWYQESDGKTYVLPNFSYSSYALKEGERLEPNSAFTMRSDIYDQLGKPDISTADKFLDVLERVKNEVKTYDGKQIVPLQLYEFTDNGNGSVDWLAEYFAIPYENEDGSYNNRRYDERYWEVLKFLNAAYNRGLISKDNFTDKRDQINEKVASGRVFAQLTAPQDFTDPMRTLFNNDSNAKFEAFALRNYEGADPVLTDIRGYGWLVTMVSKKSAAHERIAKLLEFLYSKEGQHIVHFGWEGETYTYNDDGTIAWTEQYKQALEKGDGSERQWGMGFNLLMDWYSVRDLFPQPETAADIYLDEGTLKEPLLPYSYDNSLAGGKAIPDHPDRDEMLEIGNRIALYWGRELPRIIMAATEDEARSIYLDTLEKMDAMGRERYDAYTNELFQNGKKALNKQFAWPLYQ